SKQKILLLYDAPHPDIGAIHNAIKSNINLSLDVVQIEKFTQRIDDYNLVVLHGLPSLKNSSTLLLKQIIENQIPCLFFVTSNTDLVKFNSLGIGSQIHTITPTKDIASSKINNSFSIFLPEEDFIGLVEQAPPLIVPFAEFKIGSSSVFSYQKIGNIENSKPLIWFNDDTRLKYGVFAGEGIWQWRVFNYRKQNNFSLFDNFINLIFNYLSIRDKRQRFKVQSSAVYSQSSAITMTAEVYDKAMNPVLDANVQIALRTAKQDYPFSFNNTGNKYYLNAGTLPQGIYTYKATATYKDELLEAQGSFAVVPVNIESQNTTAQHHVLHTLSQSSGGAMFYPQSISQIESEISNNQSIVNRTITEREYIPLINIQWILFIIIVFVSIEWFIRKLMGGY
ncbi:MAG: hypothetical protein SNJ71_06145, partial [Bacteroidales bacterium]